MVSLISNTCVNHTLIHTPDALQQLGIIPRDIAPPVKLEQDDAGREQGVRIMKVENDVVSIDDSDDDFEHPLRPIKLEEQEFHQVQAAHTPETAQSSNNHRIEKRKALDAELEEIEDEKRIIELRKRERRLRQEVARLEDAE